MSALPDLHAAEPIPDSAAAEIAALLQSGDLFRYTTPGAPAARLEAAFADMMGVSYALAVNSCSSALFLSLKALGLGPGDKVVIPAFTFAAVPSAIVHAGCEPVLVNVGANYRIDLGDFEARLDGASAVIISHMRGHTSNMDAIQRLCDARGLPLIEDAAHSLGTTWNGRKIGTLGRVGCFSYQSYKLVNAGEGGMLITDDAEIAARAVIMSGAYEANWKKHPRVSDLAEHWRTRLPLYNLRINNLSAVVALSQLDQVADRAARGRANHDQLAARLHQTGVLSVPDSLPGEVRAPDSLQFNLIGFDDNQTRQFRDAALAQGLDVQIFGLATQNARAFWNWNFIPPQTGLEPTRTMLMRACDVRLPARLTPGEVDAIADVLIQAVDAALGPRDEARRA
jgi:dTDP-4-amino-4,6-dideoxygalactose transaminase